MRREGAKGGICYAAIVSQIECVDAPTVPGQVGESDVSEAPTTLH